MKPFKNNLLTALKPSIEALANYYSRFENKDRQEIYEKNALIGSIKLSLLYILSTIFTFLLFFFAARYLGVEEYSNLGVLLSVFFMFSFATSLMNIVIMKFLSYFIAKSQYDKLSNFCYLFIRMMIIIGVAIFIILVAFSRQIYSLLRLNSQADVIALGILIGAFVVWNGLMGLLNGLQYFTLQGINKMIQAFFSAFFGIFLILLGFKAGGILIGLAIGTFAAIPLAAYALKNIFMVKRYSIGKIHLWKYIAPSMVVVSCIGIILNIDVPLVKYFMDSTQSGYYAAVSLLSSIVFSFSLVFSMVMFPKAAHFHSNGRRSSHLLLSSLNYTVFSSLALLLIYLLIPDFIVNVVYGSNYKIAQYLGAYTIAMSFLSISNIFIMYDLAIEKGFLVFLIPFSVVLEIFLILAFHDTIWQVITVLLVFNALLLAVLIYLNRAYLPFLSRPFSTKYVNLSALSRKQR